MISQTLLVVLAAAPLVGALIAGLGRKQVGRVSLIRHSVYALSGGTAARAGRMPLHCVQDACAGIAGLTGHENAGRPPGH